MKKTTIEKIIKNIIFLYIILPIFIFVGGWCEWYVAVPGCAILLYCFYKNVEDSEAFYLHPFDWNRKNIKKIVLIATIIGIWVILSGVGGFVWQNSDHASRNGIYEMLVDYKWPVIKEINTEGIIQNKGLIYYIGYWLPAAVIGKVYGMESGYAFQTIWAFLGISIFYYLVCVFRKKIAVWPLLVFIFMSGLDIVGYYVMGNDFSELKTHTHIEWWSGAYQYSSFTTQLFWVFNQAIPTWLIFMVLYLQRNNRYMFFIMGCSILVCTFPFVGMIPFCLYFMLERKYQGYTLRDKKWWEYFVKDTFTFENIVGGGFVGILCFLYLVGNASSQNVEMATTKVESSVIEVESIEPDIVPLAANIEVAEENVVSIVADEESVENNEENVTEVSQEIGNEGILSTFMVALLFIIYECGFYWVLGYREHHRKPLYFLTIIWLMICPWIKVGSGADFCMRASIPALVLLYLFVLHTIEVTHNEGKYLRLSLVVICLLIGSVTVTKEINRTVLHTSDSIEDKEYDFIERAPDDAVMQARNFSGEVEENFFFQYIAKD